MGWFDRIDVVAGIGDQLRCGDCQCVTNLLAQAKLSGSIRAEISSIKVATWSVNSINQRLRYLCHWLHRRHPDIIALQKIRVSRKRKDVFPKKAIEEVGHHVEELLADRDVASVAVLIRRAFLQDGQEPEVRQQGLTGLETAGRLLILDAGRVRVASVYAPYAPAGSRTKDQVGRSIHAKVSWLQRLRDCVAGLPGTPKFSFLCGDFNVILDAESKPGTLNRSPEERAAMASLSDSGFVDLYRHIHTDGRPGFNSGTPNTNPPDSRLHLILGTANVVSRVSSAWVDLEYRRPIKDLTGEKWAQGAPFIVEIDGESIL